VIAAAGCGSSQPQPFSYDTHAPLRVGDVLVRSTNLVRVHEVAFAGAGGSTVDGFIVASRASGRHPAVLFLHGSGGSDTDFLVWAAEFADAGGVGMTISQPNDAVDYAPLVVNARRAIDLLQARAGVDRQRIGVLGFSLGAQTAAILAGVDRRPKVVSLMSGRGTPTVLRYVRRAHATFFVEAGRRDEVVPQPQLRALIQAVPEPKRVRWFDAPHTLTLGAIRGQLAWLRAQLGLAR